jgi:hypothetical protein
MAKLRVIWPKTLAALALPAACALLAACATSTAQRAPGGALPARARYLAYAGAPVDHFTWLGRFDGWEALSDDELVLFVNPARAYYIRVWSPCGSRGGLRWVYHVGLTKTGGSVYARFDSVLADHWRCPISELRPVDWGRMKADARAAHKAQPAWVAPPPGGSPQPGGGPPPDATPPPHPQ